MLLDFTRDQERDGKIPGLCQAVVAGNHAAKVVGQREMNKIVEEHYEHDLENGELVGHTNSLVEVGKVDAHSLSLEHADELDAQTHAEVVDERAGDLGEHAELLVAKRDEYVGQIGEEPDYAGAGRRAVGFLEFMKYKKTLTKLDNHFFKLCQSNSKKKILLKNF